ncbi:MAG: hypothetical protein PUA93_06870 [Eubacteriales bacterium]|nr:hypothetical protein [Eubacteriales bacterium]
MKKTLLLFLFLFLLGSCSKSDPGFDLAKEKENLLAKETSSLPLSSSLEEFSSRLYSSRKDDIYVYQFILDDSKKEEKNARLLLSPNQDTVLRFGYNSSYTLVPKSGESNKDNHIIKGISLTFSSAKEISAPVKCAFYSDALEVYFAVSVSA